MDTSKCENCRFWQNQNIIGLCRRYPHQENKHKSEWCGEHQLVKRQYRKKMLRPLSNRVVIKPQVRQISDVIYINNREPFNEGTIVAIGLMLTRRKSGIL